MTILIGRKLTNATRSLCLYIFASHTPENRNVTITAPCAIASKYVCNCVNPNSFTIMFPNAPKPPVGSPFVKLMRVTDQTVGSGMASRA